MPGHCDHVSTIDRERARVAAATRAISHAAANARRVAVSHSHQFAAIDDHRTAVATPLGIAISTADRGGQPLLLVCDDGAAVDRQASHGLRFTNTNARPEVANLHVEFASAGNCERRGLRQFDAGAAAVTSVLDRRRAFKDERKRGAVPDIDLGVVARPCHVADRQLRASDVRRDRDRAAARAGDEVRPRLRDRYCLARRVLGVKRPRRASRRQRQTQQNLFTGT